MNTPKKKSQDLHSPTARILLGFLAAAFWIGLIYLLMQVFT